MSGFAYYAEIQGGAVTPIAEESFAPRLWNAVWAYGAYLGKTIWPLQLSPFYPYRQLSPFSGEVIGRRPRPTRPLQHSSAAMRVLWWPTSTAGPDTFPRTRACCCDIWPSAPITCSLTTPESSSTGSSSGSRRSSPRSP